MEPSARGRPPERSDNHSARAPSVWEKAPASSAHAAVPGRRRQRAPAPPRPLCPLPVEERQAGLPVTTEAHQRPGRLLLGGSQTRARAGAEGQVDSEPSSLDRPKEGKGSASSQGSPPKRRGWHPPWGPRVQPRCPPVPPSTHKAAVALSAFPGSGGLAVLPGPGLSPSTGSPPHLCPQAPGRWTGPSDSVAQRLTVTHACQHCPRCI